MSYLTLGFTAICGIQRGAQKGNLPFGITCGCDVWLIRARLAVKFFLCNVSRLAWSILKILFLLDVNKFLNNVKVLYMCIRYNNNI